MSKRDIQFERFNVSLPLNVLSALDEFCTDYGLSRSSCIAFVLRQYFVNLDYQRQLHNDITDLMDLLKQFQALNDKPLSAEQSKELEDIKKICDALNPKKEYFRL